MSKQVQKPTLHNIELEDLRRFSRLKELYKQAVAAKWLKHSEANLRNFVSAAVRATRVGTLPTEPTEKPCRVGDPVRIFVGIVKKQLWHHITQEQEDRAAEVLRRHRTKRKGKCKGELKSLLSELKTSLSIPLPENRLNSNPIFASNETISI